MILRLLNIALLLIWVVFLFWLLTFGKNDLIRLIHPRLWWVLAIAVVVLILYAVSLCIHHGHTENKKTLPLELPGIVILLIPIMYFFTAKDARLDGTSLENRIIQNGSGFSHNSLPIFKSSEDSYSSELFFSKILREPEKYENQDVEIVCQSFVNEELPENIAMCYRYMITCCAADALPVFIFLSHQSDSVLENNKWVRVKGPLSIIRNNNMEFPSVEVNTFEYVKEPAFPWAL